MGNVYCQDGVTGVQLEEPNPVWPSITLDRTEYGVHTPPRVCVCVAPLVIPWFAFDLVVGSLVAYTGEHANQDLLASCVFPAAHA